MVGSISYNHPNGGPVGPRYMAQQQCKLELGPMEEAELALSVNTALGVHALLQKTEPELTLPGMRTFSFIVTVELWEFP